MSALDELLSRWRSNPDADATIALCSQLGTSLREDLMREVSASANAWHASDGQVMLAVGRMHLDAGYLAEAQAALVAAGRANGSDARPFRYLGEVLLRRGDALRAEKVLTRAVQLAAGDADARVWHDHSSVLSALQNTIGVEGVAAEVSRTMPRRAAGAQPTERRKSTGQTEPSAPSPSVFPPAARATTLGIGPPGRQPPSAASRPSTTSRPGAPPTRPIAPSARSQPAPKRLSRPPSHVDDVVTTVAASPSVAPELGAASPGPEPPNVSQPPSPVTSFAPASVGVRTSKAPTLSASAPTVGDISNDLLSTSAAARVAEVATHALGPPAPPSVREPLDTLQPDAGLVLEHLSRVGVFERGGGAPPAWENPAPQRTRGSWTLALSIALIAAAGLGSYAYSKKIRSERLERAASFNDEVTRLLETGSVSDLRQTDHKLNQSFELDSLSPRAARLWLQNRVLHELLTEDGARGIDAAVHRGQSVHMPDKDTACGKVAGFMAEGDLAGGVATLARWDKDSARDPYYQLAAGAVLERAGDLRATERYDAARQLDADFVPAQLLLARLVVLEFGGERAKGVLSGLREMLGAAPITRALSALSWVVEPERSEALPDDAKLEPADIDKLPAPLRGVPAMVAAVQATRAGDGAQASRAIDSAVSGAMTPSLATALGFLAIEAGDEQLARKAALRALQFSAVYPGARTLAARVALLGGRLEEARKAIEELESSSPDALAVRGVVAYESADAGDLTVALRGLGDAARTRQAYAALGAGPGLLTGRSFPTTQKIETMATPAVIWGELVAVDAALDLGDLALASKILASRQGAALRPVHYLRLARLRRYEAKLDAALEAAAAAAEGSMTTRPLLESLYALLSKKDDEGAHKLVAKYTTLLGPLSAWLAVLVDANGKQKPRAMARAAKLDLPSAETPLTLRILVARALALSDDKRGRQYVLALAKQAPKHPDVIEAALELR